MRYVEMTIEEAMKRCNKNKKVLVAIQDLEDDNSDVVFVQKERSEYQSVFEDVKTVASACDDFVKQLRLFTEKQNIYNIEPRGRQKIILLKEWCTDYRTPSYLDIISGWQTTNKCSIIVLVRNEKAYRFTGVGAPPQ